MTTTTLSSLSKTEVELIARLSYEEKEIVTAREMDTYLPSGFPYRNQLVYSLKKKRVLIPIKSGVYIFVPFDAISTGRRVNEFLIPKAFFPKNDYYIGYSTMFNYYNFTDQQFQTVYVLNPRISRERTIAGVNFKFMKIPSGRMYGLEKITIKGKEVVVSSKERTLIDLIYYNQPVGGIDAASEILEQFVKEKKCDIKKLIDLAVRFPKIKTRKRIGIALEEAGIPNAALKALEKSVKGTALISFSKSRKGTMNERWGAIVQNSRG